MKRFLAFLLLALGATSLVAPAAEYPRTLAFDTARSFPYNLVGQLFFAAGNTDYIGSATVIRPSSVLTAGHNLYDPQTGWSTDVLFVRGTYGNSSLSRQTANRLFLLSGYRRNANTYGTEHVYAFAADAGGARFPNPVADGAYAGWTTNRSLLTGTAYKIAVGYGAEGAHNGDYPLFVTPELGLYQVAGGFYENDSVYFEGGMSGGPLFVRDASGEIYVGGIIVSGSDSPGGYVSGGIRVLNPAVATFIRTYLR